MSRPKTLPDAEILKAAAHVVAKNPAGWTLADVGDQCGLSAATIVQRFGTKKDLSIRLVEYLNNSESVPSVISRYHKDAHSRGLFAFRLIASLSSDRELRCLAGGAP